MISVLALSSFFLGGGEGNVEMDGMRAFVEGSLNGAEQENGPMSLVIPSAIGKELH